MVIIYEGKYYNIKNFFKNINWKLIFNVNIK